MCTSHMPMQTIGFWENDNLEKRNGEPSFPKIRFSGIVLMFKIHEKQSTFGESCDLHLLDVGVKQFLLFMHDACIQQMLQKKDD